MGFLRDLLTPNVERLKTRLDLSGLHKALTHREPRVRREAAGALGVPEDTEVPGIGPSRRSLSPQVTAELRRLGEDALALLPRTQALRPQWEFAVMFAEAGLDTEARSLLVRAQGLLDASPYSREIMFPAISEFVESYCTAACIMGDQAALRRGLQQLDAFSGRRRAGTLASVLGNLSKRGNRGDAEEIKRRLLDVLSSLGPEDLDNSSDVLIPLAKAESALDRRKVARLLRKASRHRAKRQSDYSVVVEFGHYLADSALPDWADLLLAEDTSHSRIGRLVFTRVAIALRDEDLLRRSAVIAEGLADAEERVRLLVMIAMAWAGLGVHEEAQKVMATAQSTPDWHECDSMLAELAAGAAAVGDDALADEVDRAAGRDRSPRFFKVASQRHAALAERTGNADVARRALAYHRSRELPSAIEEWGERYDQCLVRALVASGLADEARSLLSEWASQDRENATPGQQLEGLLAIARVALETGLTRDASDTGEGSGDSLAALGVGPKQNRPLAPESHPRAALDIPKVNVVYRETKPNVGSMRRIVVEQALQLLEIRLDILKQDSRFHPFTSMIDKFVSGYDDSCSSAVVGVAYRVCSAEDDDRFTNWAFQELLDRELKYFDTWDSKFRGETSLDGFLHDFR